MFTTKTKNMHFPNMLGGPPAPAVRGQHVHASFTASAKIMHAHALKGQDLLLQSLKLAIYDLLLSFAIDDLLHSLRQHAGRPRMLQLAFAIDVLASSTASTAWMCGTSALPTGWMGGPAAHTTKGIGHVSRLLVLGLRQQVG